MTTSGLVIISFKLALMCVKEDIIGKTITIDKNIKRKNFSLLFINLG
jgi:hypothetical protein